MQDWHSRREKESLVVLSLLVSTVVVADAVFLPRFDADGGYIYSRVVMVNPGDQKNAPVSIYPNPATVEINITGPESGITDLRIYNLLLQDVTGQTTIVNERSTWIRINLESLPAGVYYLKTSSGVRSVIKK